MTLSSLIHPLLSRLVAAPARECQAVSGVSYFYGYWFSSHRRA